MGSINKVSALTSQQSCRVEARAAVPDGPPPDFVQSCPSVNVHLPLVVPAAVAVHLFPGGRERKGWEGCAKKELSVILTQHTAAQFLYSRIHKSRGNGICRTATSFAEDGIDGGARLHQMETVTKFVPPPLFFLRKRKWAVCSEYNRVGLGLRTFRRDMSRHLLRLESRQACLLRQQQQQQQEADFAASPKKYYFNIRKKHSSHSQTNVCTVPSLLWRTASSEDCSLYSDRHFVSANGVFCEYALPGSSIQPIAIPDTTRQTERVTLLKGGFTG